MPSFSSCLDPVWLNEAIAFPQVCQGREPLSGILTISSCSLNFHFDALGTELRVLRLVQEATFSPALLVYLGGEKWCLGQATECWEMWLWSQLI